MKKEIMDLLKLEDHVLFETAVLAEMIEAQMDEMNSTETETRKQHDSAKVA